MAQVADYEHYKRIKLLGEGAFGKAFLAECVSDNTLCVIKQVDLSKMSDQEKKDTLREAKILESFNHPNIVKFKEVYKTKKGKLCIVMDYADGGDLAGKIKSQKGQSNFPENQILDWFTQICLALKHVHDRKIIHRDLKGQNIFLTKSDFVKLGDFGIARVLSTTRENAKTMVGTPYYLSPEIINGKAYSFKSDIWSLGVVLYEMCALKPPFDAQSLTFLAMKIVKGQYSPVPTSFSRELKGLVSTLLQVDPLKRPNVNEILKFPIIQNRIQNFLSKSVKIQEFSHTVLHKQQFVKNNIKFDEIKSVNNEAPIPDYLLKQQKEKDAANPKPPLPKQNTPQQAINRPAFPPQNNDRPRNPVNEPPQNNRIANNNTPANNAQPKNNYHFRNNDPTPQNKPVYEPYKGPKIVEVSKDKVPEPIDAVKAIQEQVKNIEERVNNWNRYAPVPEPKDRFVNRPANEPQKVREFNYDIGNNNRAAAPVGAQVKQQNQQYQRPEPVKKGADREILGGGGGGMAFNFAPSSNKNANNAGAKKKDLFVAGNAAAKKKPAATPVASVKQQEMEKREALAQQKLADAKKKQEEERVKKEKKALAEVERKQIMENLRQEKEKAREANRKKMIQDINKKRGAFKQGAQVEIYDIRGNSLTDLKDEDEEETKTAPGSDTKTEPKVSPPKQERTTNRAKDDVRKNISRGFSMEEIIKKKVEEEEEDASKVKRKPMKRGFTKPAKINKEDQFVEIFVPGKKNPLTAEDVNQEQPVYDYPEDHKEPDLFEGIDANSDNGAILDSEPDLGDEKGEDGKDDPFISRLEQDIKFYSGNQEMDPKDLENLQDITNLIDELNNAVNEDGEENGEQEGKLNSNRDLEQEDRDDDPLDVSTENTEPVSNQVDEGLEAMMDYSKLELLKMKLENILGVDTFLKAYRVIKELLQKHTLDEIEEKYGRSDNYASLFPFMTEEALKNDLGFVFTYVVCEEKAEESHM